MIMSQMPPKASNALYQLKVVYQTMFFEYN